MMRLPLSLALLTALPALAAAQDAQPRPMLSEACRTEITNLCPKGGERGARRQCMMSNRDKISGTCRAEMRKAMEARRAAGGGGRRGLGGSGDMSAPGAMTTETPPK